MQLFQHPISYFFFIFVLGFLGAHFAKKQKRDPWVWAVLFPLLGMMGVFLFIFLGPKKKKVVSVEKPQTLPQKTENFSWYYLDEQNSQRGPFSLEGLKSLWKQGSLKANSYIWNETYSDWKKIGEIKEVLEDRNKEPA